MRGYRHLFKDSARFIVARGPITNFKVDAVVRDTCNGMLVSGKPSTPHEADIETAGGSVLANAVEKLPFLKPGARCPPGSAVITEAGPDMNAKFVIHTNGPCFRGSNQEKFNRDLYVTYQNCLRLANLNNVKSIAFPPISYGPKGAVHEDAVRFGIHAAVDHMEDIEDIIFVAPNMQVRSVLESAFLHHIDYFTFANCDDHRPIDFSMLDR